MASAVSSSSSPALLRVLGVAQSYEWGKIGPASAVGQLMASSASATPASASSTPFKLEDGKPYAELWMGTHSSGPSSVVRPDGSVASLREHLGAELPFLFKVLSVGKALSIQAHPNASLAQQLHAERPNVYKDPQHKPELACALTPFEAMCAFRPLGEVAQHAREYPEFRALLGQSLSDKLQSFAAELALDDTGSSDPDPHSGALRKELLREVFAAMMTPKEDLLKEQLAALQTRLEREGVKPSVPTGEPGSESDPIVGSVAVPCRPLPVAPLMLRLAQQYPGDVGLFAPLVLNCFALRPGAAIFLGPCEPHAYLAGDCVECMACSDNVVRAGLTPKLRDTDVLLSMLTYREHTGLSALMKPRESLGGQAGLTEYAPPKEFGEFRLLRAQVGADTQKQIVLPAAKGASILLVFSGEGSANLAGSAAQQQLRRGDVFLVPAGEKVQLNQTGDEKVPLLVFQCTANEQQ